MTDHGRNKLPQEFITWNAKRMVISEEDSLNRFLASQAAFPGRPSGREVQWVLRNDLHGLFAFHFLLG